MFAVAASAALLAACSSSPAPRPHAVGSTPQQRPSGAGSSSQPSSPLTTRMPNLPPEGFFSTHCLYSHSERVDPIVFPTLLGMSHLHDFFGNTSTAATSTPDTLRAAASTTCSTRGDQASYWTPAFFLDGTEIRPAFQNEYWFDGGFRHVRPVPFGMSLAAGDSHAPAEQPASTTSVAARTGPSIHPTARGRSTVRPTCAWETPAG
jgi:Domain of unknown function (DUF1996)